MRHEHGKKKTKTRVLIKLVPKLFFQLVFLSIQVIRNAVRTHYSFFGVHLPLFICNWTVKGNKRSFPRGK